MSAEPEIVRGEPDGVGVGGVPPQSAVVALLEKVQVCYAYQATDDKTNSNTDLSAYHDTVYRDPLDTMTVLTLSNLCNWQ